MAKKKGKNKFNIQTTGFDEVLNEIHEMGGNITNTAKRMCLFPARIVTKQMREEMKKHEVTGDTEKAIIEPKEYFDGVKAYSEFGFNLDKKNVAIVFLEKGTPTRKKKPIIAPSIRRTKKECHEIQRSVATAFYRHAERNKGS